MRRVFLYLLIIIGFSFFQNNSVAQNRYYQGYSGGRIATDSTGYISGFAGVSEVSAAIKITSDQIAFLRGSDLVAVRVGMPEGKTLPENITVWVRNEQTSANITNGTEKVSAGWNVIELDAPIRIDDAINELWIGYSFNQTTKTDCISFAGETNENACFAGKGGRFSNMTSRNWGSLSIEGVFSGTNLPQHDLRISSFGSKVENWPVGEDIVVNGHLFNNGLAKTEKTILHCVVSGSLSLDSLYDLSAPLAYRNETDFSIKIPTVNAKEGQCKITISPAEGLADPDSPLPSLGSSEEFIYAYTSSSFFPRTMVVEEGTGTWCGFCVRGIVSVDVMKEKHPDSFLCIAAHMTDAYETQPYSGWLDNHINGYPNIIVNRDGRYLDPNPVMIEQEYNDMSQLASFGIETCGEIFTEPNATEFRLSCHSQVTSVFDADGLDCRVVFVLVEDSVLTMQKNNYADPEMGIMGGFENLPSVVQMKLNDIALGAWPDPEGTSGSLPASMSRNGKYAYDFETIVTGSATSSSYYRLIALLVDGKDGHVINAAGAPVSVSIGSENIRPEMVDGELPIQLFTLDGRPVDKVEEDQKGVFIEKKYLSNGQVFTRKKIQ